MNPISKREATVCSEIAQRLFNLLRLHGTGTSTYEGGTVTDVFLDLEYVNDVCPLDLDKLLAFENVDFLHDMSGIYRHFNRDTKKLENGFTPRSSKCKTVVVEAANTDTTIMDAINAKEARQKEIVAQTLGVTSGEAFDKSRATNLYLMTARDLGTNLGGADLVGLLAYRTDWDMDKCRRLANQVVEDPAIVALLAGEGIPEDTVNMYYEGTIATRTSPDDGEAFDRSRATNIYLAAVRDLGTDLGGFGTVDLLADNTDWDLDKCRALAEYIINDDSIKRLLEEEGIPKFIVDQDYAFKCTDPTAIDPVREYVDSDEIALARGATQDELDKENL